jgi:GntR family transcriptional regulator/MocR family aminotransferase
MDDVLSGLLDLRRSDEPLTRGLANHLRSLIASGRLTAGQRLPSSRTMAHALDVSRNTVSFAIEQLAAEGYLSIGRGRRPVVAESLALISARQSGDRAKSSSPKPLSSRLRLANLRQSRWARYLSRANWPPVYQDRARAFQPGLADEREFPHDLWARCLRRAATNALRQGNRTHNDPRLQEALLRHIAENRGIQAKPEQIFILPSAQSALALVGKVMIDAGDVGWIESPGYSGAVAALRAADAEIVGMPLDADGLKITRRGAAPRLIFVTPSHQYPTGRLMPVGRRLELLQFASRSGATIIEDDYDGEFQYEGRPIAAFAGLAPYNRTIYLGTFSKAMFADIRVGYLIVPETVASTFVLAQRHLGLLVPVALQLALADFIAAGHYRSHVRRMTRLYRTRRDRLVETLAAEARGRLLVDIPAGGMQLLARGDTSTDDIALSRQLAQAGVTARPLSEMLLHKSRERGLFLGFAAWNEAEIDAGARIIGRHLR